jgi:hypothetical protein
VEFNQLLASINSDTPLGYVVRIRAEKDPNKVREMTPNEKDIRKKWQQFVLEQNKKTKTDNLIHLKKEDISKVFSKMFG